MNFRSGIRFSQRRERKNCIENRNSQEQSAKRRKSEEMIHVLAEVVKNIKNVVVNN